MGDRARPTIGRSRPKSGSTYAENARGKAVYGRAGAPADAWVIGEDSGIEAAGIGGRPGIASARWADDGIERMLAELEGVADRRARYVCAIVAIGPDGDEIVVEGTLEGTITTVPLGDEGFGYDPIFVPTGEERTVAELGDAWKAANSHRARAAAALGRGAGHAANPGALAADHGGCPIHACLTISAEKRSTLPGASSKASRRSSRRSPESARSAAARRRPTGRSCARSPSLSARGTATRASTPTRSANSSVAVGRAMGLDGRSLAEVEAGALLHDVGKIGVPDSILHKPGPLDYAEWDLMREHPVIGERILLPAPRSR